MVQLLSPERVAIADTKSDQHVEIGLEKIALKPPTPALELLQKTSCKSRG